VLTTTSVHTRVGSSRLIIPPNGWFALACLPAQRCCTEARAGFFSIGALDARLAIRPVAVRAFRGFEKHLRICVDLHTNFYPLAAQMPFV
jgi:hypothetical protein